MVSKGIIGFSKQYLFTCTRPVIGAKQIKPELGKPMPFQKMAFSSSVHNGARTYRHANTNMKIQQSKIPQKQSLLASKMAPLPTPNSGFFNLEELKPKVLQKSINQSQSMFYKPKQTFNSVTSMNVQRVNSIIANDSIKTNKEHQLKIQEQMEATIRSEGVLKHHYHNIKEGQKLAKILKGASKTTPLQMPPSLSEVDLGRIYNDLIVDYQNDMPDYSSPNTDSNIVSVVFVRHGQSTMNKDGIFQGWIDCPLSEKGIKQATEAGQLLKKLGYHFDVTYTSRLLRATDTTDIILEQMGLQDQTYIHKSWRLNERHYGHLQGKSKQQTVDEFGKEQVKLWRQSFNDPPPKINFNDPDHPRFDELYKDLTEAEYQQMPVGESLKMTRERVVSYWKDQIFPSLKNFGGKQILFSTHKHVLRGMVQYLAELKNEQVPDLIIPNASPFVFEFDLNQDMKVVKNYYVDDATKEVFENQKQDEVVLK